MADNSYLPQTGDDLDLIEFSITQQPESTYVLDSAFSRVVGTADGLEALRQSVYLILSTERYLYPIYSHNYGTELADLIGQPKDYVMSEIKRRITDALTQDDRITGVDSWDISSAGKTITAVFTVHSVYGDIETAKEIDI